MANKRAVFTLRMSRTLQLQLVRIAATRGISLNELIVEAIDARARREQEPPEYNPDWTFGEPVR